MMLKDIQLTGTTDGDGDVVITAERSILGRLVAVEWIDGAFDNGVDGVLKLTKTASGVDVTLATLTDANDDKMYYPVTLLHGETGAALTGTAGGDRTRYVLNGTLVLTIAQGGDTKLGGCIVYYEC